MHAFRIIQKRPLTSLLPYEVEQRRWIWYLPWPVWCSVQDRTYARVGFGQTPLRFQTSTEAQSFIETVVQQYAFQQAYRALLLEELR
jgi:hypothetical protein